MINSDEEVGSLASAALLAKAAQGKRAALTYEPAALPDGTLAGARPGSGNFAFVVRGRSAHAGRNPEEGRNALLAAAELALRLDKLKRDGLTVNPSRIEGGGPSNVVPDLAILRVNMRPRTPEIEASAKREIDEAVAAVAAEHDVEIEVSGGFGRPPKPLTREAEALFNLVKQAGADLGQAIAWQPSGGVCDGNNIAACGVPVVDTMGVRGGKIHSMEEFLISRKSRRASRLVGAHHPAADGAGGMSYRVRPATGEDFRAIYQMAKLTGGGFTNLPPDRQTLVAKLERSQKSFTRERRLPDRRPLHVRPRGSEGGQDPRHLPGLWAGRRRPSPSIPTI